MTSVRMAIVMGGLIGGCVACASTWPIGRELSRAQAGLVGDWTIKSGPSGKATVWRFESRGRVELLNRSTVSSTAEPREREKREFRGTWWVYESNLSDRRPLVCFGYRPGREWPSCHWFTIDTVRAASDSSGAEPRRRLIWQGWAGEPITTTDTLLESRRPPIASPTKAG